MSLGTTNSQEFTTIPELAADWRVSIAHIHNLIKRAQLPAYRVGFRYIIRRTDAQEFLQQNATARSAAA